MQHVWTPLSTIYSSQERSETKKILSKKENISPNGLQLGTADRGNMVEWRLLDPKVENPSVVGICWDPNLECLLFPLRCCEFLWLISAGRVIPGGKNFWVGVSWGIGVSTGVFRVCWLDMRPFWGLKYSSAPITNSEPPNPDWVMFERINSFSS